MARILNNVEKQEKFHRKALQMTNGLNMPYLETFKVLDLFSL